MNESQLTWWTVVLLRSHSWALIMVLFGAAASHATASGEVFLNLTDPPLKDSLDISRWNPKINYGRSCEVIVTIFKLTHSTKLLSQYLARLRRYDTDKTNARRQTDVWTPGKMLKATSVVVPAANSRATFCHDDTETQKVSQLTLSQLLKMNQHHNTVLTSCIEPFPNSSHSKQLTQQVH